MKRVTIQDIADALGVSRNTVSKAINNSDGLAEATREKILQKAVEMGYKQFSYVAALSGNSRFVPSGASEPPAAASEIMDQLCNAGGIVHQQLVGGEGIAIPLMGAVHEQHRQSQRADHLVIGPVKHLYAHVLYQAAFHGYGCPPLRPAGAAGIVTTGMQQINQIRFR